MPDPYVPERLSERENPHSFRAEQCVLGSILLSPDKISTAVSMLKPEAFYIQQHRALYMLMLSLYNGAQSSRIDEIVVLHEAVQQGIFPNEEEGRAALMAFADETPSSENIKSYCEIVAERYCARQLSTVAKELMREITEGTHTAQVLLDSAEQRIYDIRQGRDIGGLVPIHDVVVRAYSNLSKMSGDDRDMYVGAKTGYSDLDNVTGGMNNSDLVILAARPGMGKTSFALNIATNLTKKSGRTVAIYSLEMSMEQLVSRMLSTDSMVDSHKLRTGRLEPKEWSQIAASADVLSRTNIFLSEATGITVAQMKAQLRRVNNLGLVVIDYLQLMDAPLKSENRVLVISDITRNLKLMAKELNVPVLLLSQLNRGVESRTDKRPMMSDLRESGSIEQDADIIMFLYNDYYYQKDKSNAPSITECIVAKNRHGETRTVELIWDPQHTRFSSKAREDEAPPV